MRRTVFTSFPILVGTSIGASCLLWTWSPSTNSLGPFGGIRKPYLVGDHEFADDEDEDDSPHNPSTSSASSSMRTKFDDDLDQVRHRLIPCMTVEQLKKRGVRNEVEIYVKPNHASDRLMRVGRITIDAPPDVVAERYWTWQDRKVFDYSNITDSKVINEVSTTRKLVYLVSKAKPMCSPRDFAMISERTDHTDGSVTFVQASQPTAIPATSNVRGETWSMFHVQSLAPPPPPQSSKSKKASKKQAPAHPAGPTRVTYAIECTPNGWIPVSAAEILADEVPLVLATLKADLEKHQKKTATLIK